MTASYDLSGKTAVVTGGARGIGRAIAERLAKSGARVRVWDLDRVDTPGIAATSVDVPAASRLRSVVADIG